MKRITIPVIALAAGIGLAACGSQAAPTGLMRPGALASAIAQHIDASPNNNLNGGTASVYCVATYGNAHAFLCNGDGTLFGPMGKATVIVSSNDNSWHVQH